ncbi:MAG: single-stranded DNA-binding protein [Candidatus Omnitrophota bacterium]|nr:MAG: single-stranded DNA-binding protein [Candidatus Omnitrophota bacterium]
MASLNKVFLIGNLTRDPELRYTPGGTAVVSFGIAVNRVFRDSSGEKKEETCFVRVVAFGKQAESCNQYLTKGRLVFVEGRLQNRSWESNGHKHNTLDVIADRVQFLSRGKEEVSAISELEEEIIPEQDISTDEEVPF